MFNHFLDSILASMSTHSTGWTLGGAYVFTAAINSLPAPGSGKPVRALLYQWVFDFMHVLTHRIVQRFPQAADPTPVAPAPKV